jgi:hypothetical protein
VEAVGTACSCGGAPLPRPPPKGKMVLIVPPSDPGGLHREKRGRCRSFPRSLAHSLGVMHGMEGLLAFAGGALMALLWHSLLDWIEARRRRADERLLRQYRTWKYDRTAGRPSGGG